MAKNKFEFEGKEYEYDTHISMENKYVLAQSIVDGCIVTNEENGLICVDEILKETLLGLYIIKFYSNLELPEGNILEAYDKLYEIIEEMEYQIDDIDIIKKYIDNMLDFKVNKCQSLEFIVKSKLDELISKLPNESVYSDMLTKGISALNSIDPTKLKIVVDSIGKKEAISETKKELKSKKNNVDKLN